MLRKIVASFLLACVPSLAAAGPAAQQTPLVSELFSRLEEFNKLYVEKKRAGAGLPAFDALRQRAEAAFKQRNLPLIIETVGEGIAALQGKPWDERQKFISSLSLDISRAVIEPNQDLQVSLSQMYEATSEKAFPSQPTATFEVRWTRAVASGESAGPALTSPLIIAEKLAIGEIATTATRRLRLPDGMYTVVAVIQSGGQKITEISRPLYAINDFSEQVAGLSAQVNAIKSSSEAAVKAVAPLVTTVEYRVQRLSALGQAQGEYEINPHTELAAVDGTLAALRRGQNPFAGERGELERAYLSADGNLVPYRIYVPKSYTGAEARPLVVMLHGVLGDERYFFSWVFDPDLIKSEAERRGVILAAPLGGGRLGAYVGKGQDDVLEVIKSVSQNYKTDPARVYLMGHSLGAGGTWSIASARPELFAAIAPVAGGGPAQPDAATSLIEKVKSLPTIIAHGARDGIVPLEGSKSMYAAAQKAGMKVSFIEIPDADHLSIVVAAFPQILDFFEKNSRQPENK